MFEKEAEEYIDKLTKDWFDGEYSISVEQLRQAVLHFAEFGYNKANEWHYNGVPEKENAELEAQIEKMKCWCNCKNYLSCLEECCRKNISFEKGICYNCKKWELRR